MPKARKSHIAHEYLLTYIEKNLFAMSDRLPSENQLALDLHLSRSTVRKALAELSDSGVIYKKRGAGTYIDKQCFLKLVTKSNDLQLKEEADAKIKVALIVQGQDQDANADFQRGVLSVFRDRGVILKIYATDNRFANERFCLENLMVSGFDGFIVDGVKASLLNPNLSLYKKCFDELNLPIIFYNNYYRDLPYPYIVTDDRKCSHLLTSHLLSLGHRHIAGIFVCDNYQALEKFHGMYHTFLEKHVAFNDDYVKWCVSDEAHHDRFKREIERFLLNLADCTAVVCCNSILFKLLLEIKERLSREHNKNFTIVSFDLSADLADKTGVICSVHQGFSIGQKAALNLLAMIKDPAFKTHLQNFSSLVEPKVRLTG